MRQVELLASCDCEADFGPGECLMILHTIIGNKKLMLTT